MAERPPDGVKNIGEEQFLRIDGDRAGFDLRQIKNIADQVEKIGACAVNGAGKFGLFVREISVRIVGKLLPKDKNAVERRPQLVGHIRKKFRLIFRGEGELRCFLLECTSGLLDFLVLSFDFDVSLGKLLRLLLQLLVGLLQFTLLRLQFSGELLRLLEQPFRLHGCFDGVEHDTDAGGQLLEEHRLQRRELGHRCQFDDGLDLIFEEDRQNHDVARHDLEQRGCDRHGVRRHVGDQHPALIGMRIAR